MGTREIVPVPLLRKLVLLASAVLSFVPFLLIRCHKVRDGILWISAGYHSRGNLSLLALESSHVRMQSSTISLMQTDREGAETLSI